jgi:hypothetical protein
MEDYKEGKLRKTFHFYFEGMSPDFCDRTFGTDIGNRQFGGSYETKGLSS